MTKLESAFEAKNTYAGAISSGCAGRPIGVSAPNSDTSSGFWATTFSGVHTGPGATQFTRMPRSTRFCASDFVNAWIAPFGELVDRFDVLLEGRVVHEYVDRTELPNDAVDCRPAELGLHDITGDQERAPPRPLDVCARLGRVALLFREIHDRNVRAFAREHHRDRTTDARVSARHDGDPVRELARRTIVRR